MRGLEREKRNVCLGARVGGLLAHGFWAILSPMMIFSRVNIILAPVLFIRKI